MSTQNKSRASAGRLSKSEQRALAQLIAESTAEAVAARIQIAPRTLRTVVAGLPATRGTLALVRSELAVDRDRAAAQKAGAR